MGMAVEQDNELNCLPLPTEWVPGSDAPVAQGGRVNWLSHRDSRVADRLERSGVAAACDINIHITESAGAVPHLDEDESYRLVASTDSVTVTAPSVWGALHAVTTLDQIGQADQLKAGLQVRDAPRFAWRGLLIDVARHYLSVDVLKRVVVGMAHLKLNVLHLHLSDDQGMRFASNAFPTLASAEHYTQQQLGELVGFAAGYGVRVVPELDVPGHVTSWLVGVPRLALRQVGDSERYGVHQACLDPTDEATYDVLAAVLNELAAVFPDRYLHIGGDEVHPRWWSQDPGVQAFMQARGLTDVRALQNYFTQRVCKIVGDLGKVAIGWDEVLHPDMPHIVVQNWRGATTRDRTLNRGLDCIVSAPYYLDLFYPSDMHYRYDPEWPQSRWLAQEDADRSDPRLAHVAQGLAWTLQWRDDQETRTDTQARVLGGEACLWSELVDEDALEVRLWSRLPAVAERLWSSRTVDDVDSLYRRMPAILERPPFSIGGLQRTRLSALGLTDEQCTIAAFLEPVKWYARLLGEVALNARIEGREMPQARPYDVTSTFDKIVDHIAPESLAARSLLDLSWVELQRDAERWCVLDVSKWPEDIRAAISAMRAVGELVKNIDNGREEIAEALESHYGPHGEYVLAVVPYLVTRFAR